MRFKNVQNAFFGILAAAGLCVWLALGATPIVEAAAVPTETVGVSDSSDTETTEAVETASDSSGDTVSDGAVLYTDVGSDFTGLAYLDVSSNLGDIRLYLPYGVEAASIHVVDGQIINTNSSTVYLYCPSYPDYTFSAARFSPVSYRTSGYDTVELTNVETIESNTPFAEYQSIVLTFCVVCIMFAVVGGVTKK